MFTLQTTAPAESRHRNHPDASLESALRRLSPSMTRAAAETAGAFFCAKTSPGATWEAPRLTDLGSLHCSQKNMGEKYEMTCNLGVERSEWDKLFTSKESEQFKMDAFCEMANCICGTLLADPGFSDEFGYLIPCVPCSGPSRAPAGSRTLRGAFRLSGILVYFAFTVQEAVAAVTRDFPLTAVA